MYKSQYKKLKLFNNKIVFFFMVGRKVETNPTPNGV